MTLPTTIEDCHQLIVKQAQALEHLLLRVAELERRLGENSGNSHRPPSSDGLQKKPAFPRSQGGKRGGKPGHAGSTLKMVAAADRTQPCRASVCCCGADLAAAAFEMQERRQVFDLAEPKLEVTEYQLFACRCPGCGSRVAGAFPDWVQAPVQYGQGVKALVALLSNSYHLSYQSIQQLFGDLYGFPLNENTLVGANECCYEALQQSEQAIRQAVEASAVGHFDETGHRVEGKLQWLHVASTREHTYLFAHAKRGAEALRSEQSVLASFKGCAVHDCWPSYFAFENCSHTLCGAHLLRELQAQIEAGSQWAGGLHELLLQMYQGSEKGRSALKEPQSWLERYDQICRQGQQQEPPPEAGARGKPKKTKGRNLLERLIKHKQAVLAFALQPLVPFTNNQAERDLRPAKVKQKVSGCFRTAKGAKVFARIQGFVSTARKQQRNVFQELRNAIIGQPFISLT
jgi:transposase